MPPAFASLLPASLRAAAAMLLRGKALWARLLRVAGVLILLGYFLFGALVLTLRYAVLPNIDHFRPDIVAAMQRALGTPVALDAISADWSGIRPRFHLGGVRIGDPEHGAGLSLQQVDGVVAWSSLLRLAPHFYRLEIRSPNLGLSRDAQGRLHVAGIAVDEGGDQGGAVRWLMAQREVVIRDARLEWRDALRGAPPLVLERMDLRLVGRFGRYRFGVTAHPPAALAAALDLRGELRGQDPLDPKSWSGDVYLDLPEVNIATLQQWVDVPWLQQGRGGVRAWLRIGGGAVSNVLADLKVSDVVGRLGDGLPELALTGLQGRVRIARSAGSEDYALEKLSLQTRGGLRLAPVTMRLRRQVAGWGLPASGSFEADRLAVGALAQLAAYLPLDTAWRQRLAALAPQGEFTAVKTSWRGTLADMQGWSVDAAFHDLGVRAEGRLPGVSGLSGTLRGDQASGSLHLEDGALALDLPAVFPVTPLRFTRFGGDLSWGREERGLRFTLQRSRFDNADLSGHAEGFYWPAADGPGRIDLQAGLTRVDGKAVWRYMPGVVNQDTRDWLQKSLAAGVAEDTRLRLQGDLRDFPFRDNHGGVFQVSTRVSRAHLVFTDGWPDITGIDGKLLFEGQKMRIEASRASILGIPLSEVVAEVPDLDAANGEVMHIHGKAAGGTDGFLRFVAQSPVAGRIGHFTDDMRAEGQGQLDLSLTMPLRHVADTTVKGEYRMQDNRLWLLPGMPPVTALGGALRFTDAAFAIPGMQGSFLGGAAHLNASTGKEGVVHFVADGRVTAAGARAALPWPALAHLSGSTPWHGEIEVQRQATRLRFGSTLEGLASSLPAYLNKSTAEALPVTVSIEFPGGGADDVLQASVGEKLRLLLARNRNAGKAWGAARGGIALGVPLHVTEGGVMLAAHFARLDVDAWREAFASSGESGSSGAGSAALPLAGVALQADQAEAWGQSVKALDLRAVADAGGWKGRLKSSNADGDFDWRSAGAGVIKAHFRRLVVDADPSAPATDMPAQEVEDLRSLPDVDVTVDRFTLRDMELGRLQVLARNLHGLWQLDTLKLANADGSLDGSGRWRPGNRQETRLDFKLATSNVGKFLQRLGYPEAVNRGQATLAGHLAWGGAPTRLDYPTLQGAMKLDAEDGQFRQLDPGVGRLLGVLSLQSLPRRINLDFRDIFSSGFAFDRISGTIDVNAGVMRTDDLTIRGPAARVHLKGKADIARETQDLRVTVQPTLSESVAIGAAAGLINPVAGVVTYLAQKALSDPIEKLFSYEYAVTGSWDDPQVAKLGSRPAQPAESSGGAR